MTNDERLVGGSPCVIGANLRCLAMAIAPRRTPGTRPGLVCLALAAAHLTGAEVAFADEIANDCPQVTEVASKLDQLLVNQVNGPEAGGTADKIVIRDRGASWEIEVAGHHTSYDDPVRDCSERARVSAVFAALALEPPDHEPPAEVVVHKEAPSVAPSPIRQRIELAPALVLGLGADDTAMTWGGDVRWQISGARLALTAGLGGMMPAVVRAGAYEASLARVVFDVSPRIWLRAGSARLALELGPFAGWLFAKGRNLSPDGSSTSVDAGARLAVRVELAWRTLAPFLAAHAELSVRRFRMLVEPSGDVGAAPRVWLGLLLGAAFGR